jgi:hypothetical protein
VNDHDQFVMTGPLNEVDFQERRLRLGDHDLWVAPHVPLDGALRAGLRVVVNGHRDRSTGRSLAERLVVPIGREPARPGTAEASDVLEPPRILLLVVSLLVELRLETQALECTLLPSSDLYGIRLGWPGQSGKAVLLPRRALERALLDTGSLRTVRTLLRSAVEILHSRRGPGAARPTWYHAGLGTGRRWSGPRCTDCDGPLFAEEPIVVEAESRWHVACPPAW